MHTALSNEVKDLLLSWQALHVLQNCINERHESMQQANTVQWPESEHCFTDNSVAVQGSPKSAVMGIVPIIAHHQIFTRGNRVRLLQIDFREFAQKVELDIVWLGQIGLVLLAPVQVKCAGSGAVQWVSPLNLDLNCVAGHGDQSFDEVLFIISSLRRRFEYDNISSMRLLEAVDELVDQDMITDLQRRNHRLRWNEECLDEKRPNDQENKHDRNQYGLGDFGGCLRKLRSPFPEGHADNEQHDRARDDIDDADIRQPLRETRQPQGRIAHQVVLSPRFLDSGCLPDLFSQVEQLGAVNEASSRYLDLGDSRAVQKECALDADAVRYLSNDERLAVAIMLLRDHDPFEYLDALFAALDYLYVNLHSVADVELRLFSLELRLFDFLDDCGHG